MTTRNSGEGADLASPHDRVPSPDVGNGNGREAICAGADAIASVLANRYILMSKAEANSTRASLFRLTEPSETQLAALFGAIDAIADGLCTISGPAPTSLAWMFEHNSVLDADGAGAAGESHAAARLLADAHETVAVVALQAAALAEHEDDQTTHGMLVNRVAAHEAAARLLRSHLN